MAVAGATSLRPFSFAARPGSTHGARMAYFVEILAGSDTVGNFIWQRIGSGHPTEAEAQRWLSEQTVSRPTRIVPDNVPDLKEWPEEP